MPHIPAQYVIGRTQLTGPQVATLLQVAGLRRLDPAEQLELGAALGFWLYDMLTALEVVTSDQRLYLLGEIWEQLVEYGRVVSDLLDGPPNEDGEIELPVMRLGIADNWYAKLDDGDLIDLRAGQRLPTTEPPRPFLESRAFNLLELLMRHYQDFCHASETAAGQPVEPTDPEPGFAAGLA